MKCYALGNWGLHCWNTPVHHRTEMNEQLDQYIVRPFNTGKATPPYFFNI